MDTAPLLGYLSENTDGDRYAVFDWADLTAVSETAREELDALKTNGYAVIKYSDEGEVCLCLTSSGRAAAAAAKRVSAVKEESGAEVPAPAVKPSLWERAKTAVIAAICGLFGGVIGGAIIYLILAV
ncbi:MAG TPA: hypothetical protein H9677_05105 [Firmicutes bacterium]|nr:hypothetical protein [Bacillota bacterium]